MSENETLWKIILAEVEREVSKGQFVSLFKPTSLISLENNVATIGARDAMLMNMLRDRFSGVLIQAFSKHDMQDVKLVFVPRAHTAEKPKESTVGTLFETPLQPQRQSPPQSQPRMLPRVRQDYTFATLAISGSNQLAAASAQRVAENLGKSYNPLFIYGPVGVGKTHLMQAIANDVYGKDADLKIIYITSEEFTNEVVEAIRSNDTGRMKKRFRSANLLIIDDIQFIAGKDRVQEELFHTFNSLIDNGAQIVLSSDKPPSEIKKLEARLSSRFAGGLTVDVEPPDFEMRSAIILKKAEKFGYDLPIEVAKIIAEKEQDVRSLEGTLLRVITQATMSKETITPEIATKALSTNGLRDERSVAHPDDVIKTVCTRYGVKPTQLKGPKRDASLVKARQISMYLLYKELKLTFNDIGNLLGGRDHTTIMHGVEKMGKLVIENAILNEEIMGIKRQLGG